jgi:hypothetical protein
MAIDYPDHKQTTVTVHENRHRPFGEIKQIIYKIAPKVGRKLPYAIMYIRCFLGFSYHPHLTTLVCAAGDELHPSTPRLLTSASFA